MKKLLFITFICSSLCAYAQSEIPEDTIKNQPPVKKEQIPFSPKENKRTGLDESQPQQSLQGEQQEEINLHLPISSTVRMSGYQLLRDNKVEHLKVGRAYRVPKAHLLSYLRLGMQSCGEL